MATVRAKLLALSTALGVTWRLIRQINYEYRHVPSIVRNSKAFIDWYKGRAANPKYYPPYFEYNGNRYYSQRPMPRRILSRKPNYAANRMKRRRRATTKAVAAKRRRKSSVWKQPNSTKPAPRSNPKSEANRLLGPPPNFQSQARRTVYETDTMTAWSTLTLYSRALIRVPHSADEDAMNSRHGNGILVRGVKVHYKFALQANYVGEPITVRWAILINRDKDTATDTNTSLPTTDFFRSLAVNEIGEPQQDFVATESSLKMSLRRINPLSYKVLRQGRFNLHNNRFTNGTTWNNEVNGNKNQLSNYFILKKWLPLNTQVRFASDADTYPADHNVYIVYWAYPFGKNAAASTPNAVLAQQHLNSTYFDDITPA